MTKSKVPNPQKSLGFPGSFFLQVSTSALGESLTWEPWFHAGPHASRHRYQDLALPQADRMVQYMTTEIIVWDNSKMQWDALWRCRQEEVGQSPNTLGQSMESSWDWLVAGGSNGRHQGDSSFHGSGSAATELG